MLESNRLLYLKIPWRRLVPNPVTSEFGLRGCRVLFFAIGRSHSGTENQKHSASADGTRGTW